LLGGELWLVPAEATREASGGPSEANDQERAGRDVVERRLPATGIPQRRAGCRRLSRGRAEAREIEEEKSPEILERTDNEDAQA
jgi:hypothetical protein